MTTALGYTASELGGAHARHLVVRYLVDDLGRWLDGPYNEAVGRELVTATADLGEPKARAYYATAHARTAAADSDFAAARARLSVAEKAMDLAVDTPGISWAGHYSPGRWAHEAALVHARMGDMRAAEEHIEHALSLGLDRRRTRAMVLADLGNIRFRREDVDGAVDAWTEFVGLAEGVHSTRIDRSAADIAVRLGSVAGKPAARVRELLAQRSQI
ncbi:hypothetical protein [Actinokineospora cianjurensis]|nr:hypothetical protein [Actinokineospora cianjurensis]